METAHDQHGTTHPRARGFNRLHAPGRFDSQALCSKVYLEGHKRTHPKWIRSNGMVSACAIAILLIVIVLLELHIRTLPNHSASRRQYPGEVKLQSKERTPEPTVGLDKCHLFQL